MANEREKDDFWNIEKLLPKRAPSRLSPFATESPVVNYEPRATLTDAPRRDEGERKLTDVLSAGSAPTEDATYIPEGAGLVKKVTVRRRIDKYDFYDSFRKSAVLYFDVDAPPSEFAQFYSYMPQYAHLTPSQRSYYFWWRSQARVGRYIKTDYSYLYLYVYEILNLPDKIPPEEGIRLLCRAWREYRAALPRIDNYFAIWVEDYCLVHGLPCPLSEIGEFLFSCMSTVPLKEFFLSDVNEVGLSGTESLIAYLSDYDWRRGKYAGEALPSAISSDLTYRGHMVRAMYLLLSEIWGELLRGGVRKTLIRDAFPNTLCTHSVKCRLEIEYVSFTDSADLRAAVTAAVRYTENKLRALLGVRSRLAVKDLPPEYAAVIDRYFARFMAEENKRREKANAPAYERLYDAPAETMSLDGAEKIERLSWENARLLATDEDELVYVAGASGSQRSDRSAGLAPEGGTNATVGIVQNDGASDSTVTEMGEARSLGGEEIDYLRSLLGHGGQAPRSTPIDTLAERINEVFSDLIGDIILLPADGGYEIIEDYKEEVTEFLCSLK